MKRINPNTGRPYKMNERRSDGFYFRQYDKRNITKEGFYWEVWDSPQSHVNQVRIRKACKERINKKLREMEPLKLTKRINPETNHPYCKGDYCPIKKKYFRGYETKLADSDGIHLRENWATEEALKQSRKKDRSPTRIAALLYNHAKTRAKKNRANFSLTKEFILEKIKLGICEQTGIRFQLSMPLGLYNPYAPSIDRVLNTNRDYTKENTQIVIRAFNILKGPLDIITMETIMKSFLKKQKL